MRTSVVGEKILAIFLSNGSLFRAHGLHIPI